MTRDEIKDNLKFYKWSKIDAVIEKESPIEYDMDEFFDEIRKDPPYTDTPAYIINNTQGGKSADDFYCPSMIFFDIDFHFDNDKDRIEELKLFYQDTNTTSLQEFVDKLNMDKSIISAGLSKSGIGIRGFACIITPHYIESLKYELDYPTDWNKQIHKSNWMFMMQYLCDTYGIRMDRKYTKDVTANRLHQVTFHYRLTGSFYHEDWTPMYNDYCVIKTVNRYETDGKLEKYNVEWLDTLYHQNEQQFHKIFEHFDSFHSIFYALRNQSDEEIMWHYKIINECYSPIGGFRKQGHLDTGEKFYTYVKSHTTGEDLPLSAFYFHRNVYFNDPLILEDDIILGEDEMDYDLIMDDLKASLLPMIDDKIIGRLPKTLQDLCKDYNGTQRDMILLSSLSTMSIFFTDVKSTWYMGGDLYSNLYSFIVGDTGGGKSITKKSKLLVKKLSDEQRISYSQRLKEWGELDGKEQHRAMRPPEIKWVIGGDGGRAAIIKYLINNDEKLLLFEMEASIIGQNDKASWDGSYTDILRLGLENETIDKIRKGEDSTYIESPRLSITVTGTLDQIPKAIGTNGITNGTFNRFTYYWLWNDTPMLENPHGSIDNSTFERVGNELYDFWLTQINNKQLRFEFTNEQKEIFWNKMDNTHKSALLWNEKNSSGVVKRHFLMAKKICIILTMLRKMEECQNNLFQSFDTPINNKDRTRTISAPSITGTISPIDDDFINSIEIIKVYMKHSLTLLRYLLPTDKPIEPIKNWKISFFEILPKVFNKKLFKEIGKTNFNKSEKTYLRLWDICLKNKIISDNLGAYSLKKDWRNEVL